MITRQGIRSWLRFNAVSLMGIPVQMSVLAVCVHGFGLHYLVATLIAVESAVLHNFVWHWRWTWAHRFASRQSWPKALLRFHSGNAMVSLFGNAAGMTVFAGWLGLPVLPANLLSIASCYILNFVLAERFAFREAAVTEPHT
jgi:putative flippase GtrA